MLFCYLHLFCHVIKNIEFHTESVHLILDNALQCKKNDFDEDSIIKCGVIPWAPTNSEGAQEPKIFLYGP